MILSHPGVPGMKPKWSGVLIGLIWPCNQVVRILWSILASKFIRQVGVQVSKFVWSLCGLSIRVIVATSKE